MQRDEIREPTFTRAGVERLRQSADTAGEFARSMERVAVDRQGGHPAWDIVHFIETSDMSEDARSTWVPFSTLAYLAVAFSALRVYERHARVAADAIAADQPDRARAAAVSCRAFLADALSCIEKGERRAAALEGPLMGG